MDSAVLIRNSIYFISIITNLVLAFLVLSQGRKKRENQTFFAACFFACGWLISLFLFYIVKDPQWVLWLGRFNFAVILPMFYYLFIFALVFPSETVIPRNIKIALSLWVGLFTILTFLTPLIGKEEIILGPGQRETVYGPLFILYALHYIVFSVAIIVILLCKLKKSQKAIEKNQIKYVLIGLSLALIFGFTTNILLYSIGLSDAANYGPLATVLFSGFIAVAILKHHLFSVKVIAAEIFTGLLVFTLLISVFTSTTPTQRIFNIAISIGSLVFGVFLIKSVIQEIRLREKSQRLANRLDRAYRELKKLDDAKSEFIAMASHQLRTPLTIIKGFVSMLMEGNYGKMPERARKPLKDIFLSNERLVKIINDLLNISKIELGKLDALKEKAQIENLIKSTLKELKPRAEKKGLYLKWEKPKKSLPELEIDSLKIRQVIFTVIDNAIRYTQKGGVVVKCHIIDNKYQIKISDTGVGMSKQETKRVFESFVRGSAGINLWVQGAGLGLYLSKKYIELHKGKIWAESSGKGKGSTFYIELPISN